MNYYEVLGVSETATDKEIKKAYKTLVKKYHPDVFKGAKSLAEEKIKLINEAYDTLINASLRQEYDKSLFVPDFSDIDLNNSSHVPYSDSTYDSSPKYEDLYKYDYYKRYTTNYYGISREDLKSNKFKNSPVKDSDFFTGSKSRFILVVALGTVFLLIVLWFLLSYLNTLISDSTSNIEDNTTQNDDAIYYTNTYNDNKYKELQNIYNMLFDESY